LLAVGTSNGLLKIYGRPGVELSARHQEETVIQELHFLPEQVIDGQILVCRCSLTSFNAIDNG